jgi:IS30 family transposase
MSRTSPNKLLRKAPFDSDRSAIEQLINQGQSDSRIAKLYNVTKDTIWCRRARWGFVSGWEVKETTAIENISELWKHGYTVEEIAESLGISKQIVYTKMQGNNIRQLPRMGIDAPNMSLTELRHAITNKEVDEDELVVVTHNRLPKWIMIPIEDYQDLANGVFGELRKKPT